MSKQLGAAVEWLQRSVASTSHSTAQVFSRALLDELKRLNDLVETQRSDLERKSELRGRETAEHRRLERSFRTLEEEAKRERDAWDASRTALEVRLADVQEKLRLLEGHFQDAHHALLYQPDHTREQIAGVIAGIVAPYTPGERPQ